MIMSFKLKYRKIKASNHDFNVNWILNVNLTCNKCEVIVKKIKINDNIPLFWLQL